MSASMPALEWARTDNNKFVAQCTADKIDPLGCDLQFGGSDAAWLCVSMYRYTAQLVPCLLAGKDLFPKHWEESVCSLDLFASFYPKSSAGVFTDVYRHIVDWDITKPGF